MSRLKNFARGVFSGYVQLAANIVFTLASVPLALHYLSKEEFALWALVTQVTSYFALIDVGMGAAVSRILADHKDDRDGGRYGGVLKAGAVVFTAQGALIAVATLLLAAPLADAFAIGPALRPDFIFLLRGHGLLLAFGFATKIFATPFWGFQRYDIANFCGTTGFALQLAVLWMGFSAGWGLKSMLAGYAAVNALNFIWSMTAGIWLGFYPSRGGWGRIRGVDLRELFTFGRDIFLMAIGAQLLSASQIVIITKLLGLDAAATWAICSKLFTLAQQAVGRIYESSAAAFAEMHVRGEGVRLLARFRDVVVMTASLAVAVAVAGAALNSTFVEVWTQGRVAWSRWVDVLLAAFLVISTVSRCHTGMSGVVKALRTMRFIYFFEGVTFVILAWLVAPWTGYAGIAAASVVAMLVWSGRYGWELSRRTWAISNAELRGWLTPAAKLFTVLVMFWIPALYLTSGLSEVARLAVLGVTGTATSLAAIWFLGLPAPMKNELAERFAKGWGHASPRS